MEEIKITLIADTSIDDTILEFKENITLEMAGHIIQYIASLKSKNIISKNKPLT